MGDLGVSNPPPPVVVELSGGEVAYALEVGERRRRSAHSRQLDSGLDPAEGDVMGVMGEMAVCMSRGYDFVEHVFALTERPKRDDLTDLLLGGVKIGVKSRARFELPLDLVVPEYDDYEDVYVLCSVDLPNAYIEIRGWCSRKELLSYKPEEWKWTSNRPGAKRRGRRRRYIPVQNLRPWKAVE